MAASFGPHFEGGGMERLIKNEILQILLPLDFAARACEQLAVVGCGAATDRDAPEDGGSGGRRRHLSLPTE
jgi:hypothetical protein